MFETCALAYLVIASVAAAKRQGVTFVKFTTGVVNSTRLTCSKPYETPTGTVSSRFRVWGMS